MSYLVKKRIWWTPPASMPADMVGFRVRVLEEPSDFAAPEHYLSRPYVQVSKEVTEVFFPDDFPGIVWIEDKTYYIYISTVDDDGNEASPFVLSHPFDFVPPPPVEDGGVSDAT